MKQIERAQKGGDGNATDDEVSLPFTTVELQLTRFQAKRYQADTS